MKGETLMDLITVTLLYALSGHARTLTKEVNAKICDKNPGSVVVAKPLHAGCEDIEMNDIKVVRDGVPQKKFRTQVEPFCSPNDDGSSVVGVICLK